MTDGKARGDARGPGGSRRRPTGTKTGSSAGPGRGRRATTGGSSARGAPAKKGEPRRDQQGAPGTRTRRIAADLLRRIDEDGAYANLAVPAALEHSDLPERDRHLVTELVYGATRRRRSCDWLVDRYTSTEPDAVVRSFLRVGAYQLAFTDIPDYAAVNATVAATPVKVRSFVNAVLRQLVRGATPEWPSDGVRLSYPDWVIGRLVADLGADAAMAALEVMNQAPPVTFRDDGYVQDLASQWVAATVDAQPGDRVLDLCAAPGGKTTAMARSGAKVVAVDVRPHRAALVAENAQRFGLGDRVAVTIADGTALPWPADGRFDRVLVDAPCSGLGALRRRPDARWRIEPSDIDELVPLQQRLVQSAAAVVRPGGLLVYSVCTLSRAETIGIDDWLAAEHPAFGPAGVEPAGPASSPTSAGWEPVGRGHRLLPQARDTDGMYLLALRRPAP